MVLKIKFITIILDSIKPLQHSTKTSLRGSQKKISGKLHGLIGELAIIYHQCFAPD